MCKKKKNLHNQTTNNKRIKTRYDWIFLKKQVEEEEMLMAMCKIEMHPNRSVTTEEEKLIVKPNAMKSQ